MSDPGNIRDVPIPPGMREEWAAELAAPAVETRREEVLKLFVCRVGGEWFGFEPTLLSQTLPDAEPCKLPHRGHGIVEGLVNADGRVIVCVAFDRFAGVLPATAASGTKRLLVMNFQKWLFAIRSDEVLGVEEVSRNTIHQVPQGAPESLRQCANGLAFHKGRAVMILDTESLVRQVTKALI